MQLNDLKLRHSHVYLGGIRFIHTADWQIGKPFRTFGEREPMLRQARLAAIENIGRLAMVESAQHVLIAGDFYDTESPTQKTLLEPLERMRQFPNVAWHVISGNHDPHRGNGLWDRVQSTSLPPNVHLHLAPESVALGDNAVLLPAPMRRKSEASDLTQWMSDAPTPPGLIRIGLAHGSVTGFDVGGEANNPIAPDRASRAGLDYLALGDWHRTMQINDRTWYAGTPEADRFNSQELGQALIVDIPASGAPPLVTPATTGTYRWLTMTEDLRDTPELEGLENRLRALQDSTTMVLKLSIMGALPISGRAELERRLSGVEASMFHLATDLNALRVRPTTGDLEAIDFGGVLREAADTLKALSEDSNRTGAERLRAEEALIQLFLMTTGNTSMIGTAS